MKHNCNKSWNGIGWSLCIVCDGRIHLEGCTTSRRSSVDCCEARHKMLHAQGHTVGLGDASLPMLGTHAP